MTSNGRDQIAQTLAAFADDLAERIAPLVAARLEPPPPPPTSGDEVDLDGLPKREHLNQREAAAWANTSISSLSRARGNGLPFKYALGRVMYHIDDLRDFLGGKYNG